MIRIAENRKTTGTFRVLCIIFVLMSGLLTSLVAAPLTTSEEPPPRYGFFEITTPADDKDAAFISQVLNDTLVQSLERNLSELTGEYQWIARLEPAPAAVEDRREIALMLLERGLMAVFWPELSISGRGFVLRVMTIDLRNAKEPGWRWAGPAETALMGRGDGFDVMEQKVVEIAASSARRLSERAPDRPQMTEQKRVLFWCVFGRGEGALGVTSRVLTLEMPYFLSRDPDIGRRYEFVGINSWDYFQECASGESKKGGGPRPKYLDFEQYDLVVNGEAIQQKDVTGESLVRFLVDAKGIDYRLPVAQLVSPLEVTDDSLANLAAEFLRELDSVTSRITMTVSAEGHPAAVRPENPTEILVRVTTTEGRPLSGAEVTITSGGGSFGGRPRSFERTPRRRSSGISGRTDREGVFKAVWSCERCAPAYVLGIRVVRKGYMEAATELEIKVSR